MSYAKGVCWIGDCRIPFVDEGDIPNDMDKTHLEDDRLWNGVKGLKPFLYEQNQQGRFTPNLLVCDDMLNDGRISKSQRGRNDIGTPTYGGNSLNKSKTTRNNTDRGFDDKGTNSRYYDLDLWFNKMLEGL